MAKAKRKTKQKDAEKFAGEVADQLEHVFLAGLGALSNAQKKGAKTFETLVKQGETFRKKTSKKTETLIDDVQDAIRDMTDDAQDRASGLLNQVRGKTKLKKLQGAFDSRVAGAMDRMHVPSKNDIDAINGKLNKILRLLDDKPKAKKVVAKKPVAKKAVAKKSVARKTSAKKAPVKKAAPKKAPARKTSTKKTTAKKA
jgi:poly(hydroxyalkanoate) granule-associated protein